MKGQDVEDMVTETFENVSRKRKLFSVVVVIMLGVGVLPVLHIPFADAGISNTPDGPLIIDGPSTHTLTSNQNHSTVAIRDSATLIISNGYTLFCDSITLENFATFRVDGGHVVVRTFDPAGDMWIEGTGLEFSITNGGTIDMFGSGQSGGAWINLNTNEFSLINSTINIAGGNGYADTSSVGPYDAWIPVSKGGDAEINVTASDTLIIENSSVNITGGNGFDLPASTSSVPSTWSSAAISGHCAAGGNATLAFNYANTGGAAEINADITLQGGKGGKAADGGTASGNAYGRGGGYSNGGAISGFVGSGGRTYVSLSSDGGLNMAGSQLVQQGGNGGDAGKGGNGAYYTNAYGAGGGGGYSAGGGGAAYGYYSGYRYMAGGGGGGYSGGNGGAYSTPAAQVGGAVSGNVGRGGFSDLHIAASDSVISNSLLDVRSGNGGMAGNGGVNSNINTDYAGGAGYRGSGGNGYGNYGSTSGAAPGTVTQNVGRGGDSSVMIYGDELTIVSSDIYSTGAKGGDAGIGGGSSPQSGVDSVSSFVADGGNASLSIDGNRISIDGNCVLIATPGNGGDGKLLSATGTGTYGGTGYSRYPSPGSISRVIPMSTPMQLSPMNNTFGNGYLDWSSVYGSTTNGAVASYQIQINTTDDFSAPLIDVNTGFNTHYSLSPIDGQTYYWRVKAIYTSPAGASAGWSEIWNFVVDIDEPDKPLNVLPTPSDWTSTNSFLVSWTNPIDLSGIAGAYYKVGNPPTGATDHDGYATDANISQISGINAPGDGTHDVHIWLNDTAGNSNYLNYNSTVLKLDTTSPTVDAGPDRAANAQFTQFSTATDLDSGIATYHWTETSGPGTVTFGTPDANSTTISANMDGGYVIRLNVTDNAGNWAWNEFTLYWDTTAPYVEIGGGDSITNVEIYRWAMVSDAGSGIASYFWSKASGPGTVTFGTQNAVDTTISANMDGEYTIRLNVTDDAGNWAWDEFTLIWDTTAPTVDAGSDAIEYGTYLQNATASDALSGISSYSWVTESGPGNVTFGTANQEDTTIFSNVSGIYVIRLNVTDSAGNKASDMFTLVWNMPAPHSLQAASGNGQIMLSWEAPAESEDFLISSYNIYQTNNSETTLIATTAGTTYTITGLINGQIYQYYVAAVNFVGEGPLSASAWATPLGSPSAPRNLQAVAGNGQVALSWDAPESDGGSYVGGYRIYRGVNSGGATYVTEVNSTSYTNTGLTNGVTYYFQVSAVSYAGEGPRTNEAVATPSSVTAPTAPRNLQASVDGDHVTLTWTAPSSDGNSAITSYILYRGTSSANKDTEFTLGNVLTYSDSSVLSDTMYYYQVSAVNGIGEGELSNEVNVRPSFFSVSVELTFSTSSFISGNDVTIYAEVQNTGVRDANSTTVEFYYEMKEWGTRAPSLIDSVTISVPAGGADTASTDWSLPNQEGNYTISVLIAGSSSTASRDIYIDDGDGFFGADDAFPNNPDEWADSDGDGIGDNADFLPNIHNSLFYGLIILMILGIVLLVLFMTYSVRKPRHGEIAILGSSGSGKTVFFAMLSHVLSKSKYSNLKIEYVDGIDYIRDLRKPLESGEWPAKTFTKRADKFSARIHDKQALGTTVHNLRMNDISGEDFTKYIGPDSKGELPEHMKYIEHACGYTLIMSPDTLKDDMWTFISMIKYLVETRNLKHTAKFKEPFAIVISKHDQHREIVDAEAYIRENAPDLHMNLSMRTKPGKLKFFFCSAVGDLTAEGKPRLPLAPVGVAEVIEWILKNTGNDKSNGNSVVVNGPSEFQSSPQAPDE